MTRRATATAKRRPAAPKGRALTEAVQAAPAHAPLKVDEAAGVIYGVKVLGHRSRNSHGADGASGTEYTREAMESARPLYEDMTVRANHPAKDRRGNEPDRDVDDNFGKLRNVRVVMEDTGEPGLRADLHYLKAHPLAPRVVEDVKRGLGVYGLSHHAFAGRERVEGGRLVVEQIAHVRSVDLVDRPATNRNLWESEETRPVKYTLRTLLESQAKKWSKPRQAWGRRLLEMGCLKEDDVMEAPVAEGAAEPAADPDEALRSGFEASLMAVIQQALSGDMDSTEALKKLKELLVTHEKLNGEEEPEEPAEDLEESEEEEEEGEGKKKPMEESTDLKAENARLKERLAVRELCESLSFIPSKTQAKALEALGGEADRRALINDLKAAAKPGKTPKSQAPGTGRAVVESEQDNGQPDAPKSEGGWISRLRGGN